MMICELQGPGQLVLSSTYTSPMLGGKDAYTGTTVPELAGNLRVDVFLRARTYIRTSCVRGSDNIQRKDAGVFIFSLVLGGPQGIRGRAW
jgi:hypothetical protein